MGSWNVQGKWSVLTSVLTRREGPLVNKEAELILSKMSSGSYLYTSATVRPLGEIQLLIQINELGD